ncbi:mechanosensitive ion channel family protein [Candidatus Izimaplasma bacterium ZiA1]|uniref:mechanosensitive ion channel family protein n=1 Tax=Candidatus Izimoplasma sp. ZiA1 TaxID=2024899 RepID=UPI00143C90FB
MNDFRIFIKDVFINSLNVNEQLTNFIVVIIMIVLILFVSFLIVRISSYTVKKILLKQTNNRTITLVKHIQSILKYVIYFVVIMIVLSELGINITPIIASAGVFGLAIGFGAQSIVKDFISGFFIIFENQFTLGDVIEVDGFKGEVIEFGLRSTKIKNWKGQIKIISNGDIKKLINFSREFSVGIVDISVAYETDMQLLENSLYNFIEKYETNEDIVEKVSYLGVVEMQDSGVLVRLIFKSKPNVHFKYERKLRSDLLTFFKDQKIDIPYPHVIVKQYED